MVVSGFTRTDETLTFLIGAFERVLRDLGLIAVAASLPWSRSLVGDEGVEGVSARQLAHARTIAFALLDIAEARSIARSSGRGAGGVDGGARSDESGAFARVFERLRQRGLTADEIARGLSSLQVEVVLTAHPTEAKRQTVLEHLERLYGLVCAYENAPCERGAREAVEVALEQLWRTGDVYLEKPKVEDERRRVVHYLSEAFPKAIGVAQGRLREAWVEAGFGEGGLEGVYPRVTFGNWVGGDRDGHPYVTAETTAETLGLFRQVAVAAMDERLREVARRLSLSHETTPPPGLLGARIAELEACCSVVPGIAARREPWRWFLDLVRRRLAGDGAYTVEELGADLSLLSRALTEAGASRIARAEIAPLEAHLRSFGLHLAVVDVRQNSGFHDRALAGLLRRVGVEGGEGFAGWPVERRRAFLLDEMGRGRRLLGDGARAALDEGSAAETVAALECYAAVARHVETYGLHGVGSFIVSMTRGVEDLAAVVLLARESGLARVDADGVLNVPVPVVPLFETIADLQRAPEVVDAWLSLAVARRNLAAVARRRGDAVPTQEVMIGYSDSAKDGGIVASMWGLQRAQRAVVEVAARHGVAVKFFHGRGGTIGRGAGPTHRFLRALPAGSVRAGIRVTEQGEAIRQKYGRSETGGRHLELLLAGTLEASFAVAEAHPDEAALRTAIETVAASSHSLWRQLVERDGFVRFFREATPLDVIEASRIGSRPSRRSGAQTLADLRAIPWVFAWNQSRFVLPGWFGFGGALSALREADGAAFELLVAAKGEARRYAAWHYLVGNVATAYMTASPLLMRRYGALASNGEGLLALILEEHERTGAVLEALYGGALSERRPRIAAMLALRDEALFALHARQIELLAAWRARGGDGDDALLLDLLETMNAIAAGLGATG